MSPSDLTIDHPQFPQRQQAIVGPVTLDFGSFASPLDPHVAILDSGLPGPTVVINGLMHGNEPCGGHAIQKLLQTGVLPEAGKLCLSLANVHAHAQYSGSNPSAHRAVDEDMNRLWAQRILDGPRQSVELARARHLRPIFESADYLLDLHSMQRSGDPMMLCGITRKARQLARLLGSPRWIVADPGHAAGPRLIDHGRFADDTSAGIALLAECGQHQDPASIDTAFDLSIRLLEVVGAISPDVAGTLLQADPPPRQRLIEITHVVTAKGPGPLDLVEPLPALKIIDATGTVIAYDGEMPIVTPYEHCAVILPTAGALPGHTALRMGRLVPMNRLDG